MKKVLFVCHGNICRSPMAEYIFKNMVKKIGCAEQFEINSAATSTEEIGNSIHYGTLEVFKKHKIPFSKHKASQMKKSDYLYYDYLIGMDRANIRNIISISGGDHENKIHKLLSFTKEDRDVLDPWYTNRFEETYQDITNGCLSFLNMFNI